MHLQYVSIVCICVCVCEWPQSVTPYLHQHDETHKEGEEDHTQEEELPAVFAAEHSGVHVDYRRHKALYAHKLIGRRAGRWEKEGR